MMRARPGSSAKSTANPSNARPSVVSAASLMRACSSLVSAIGPSTQFVPKRNPTWTGARGRAQAVAVTQARTAIAHPQVLKTTASLRRRRRIFLGRLWRSRPTEAQTDAVGERFDLPLDLVLSQDEVLEDRLVPLQAGCRDQLQPVAARGLVRRLGAAVPDRDVRIARHEVVGLRVCTGAFDRLVDQHAVREIQLEVLLIEVVAVALVARVRTLVERDGPLLGFR